MFNTVLIANRGEIACRIAATCKRLGIRTVMIYSSADADALHTQAGDEAIWVGEAEPQHSYLNIKAIIEAAQRTGAQAIHPGYGFLAENASFAQACADHGLIFIGPSAQSITAMGNKSAAKQLMEAAQVPLVPGYHGPNQNPEFLLAQADAMGYPVLIKASAGGGGKGMRIVNSSSQFLEALHSCKREAKSSFSDDHVLIERYLQKPRHIEIQVFADTQGNTVHLFERDCSVQRRHQKVIEEAPAPGMTPERRQAMGAAAVAAAQAVDYVGAGTVEFICEGDDFYFMEMNTRLQVEHPVTELITGHDLVEWQLLVATGQALPVTQDQLQITGHAFEARVYAENPNNQFLPSTGRIDQLVWPEHQSFNLSPLRIDSGIRQGDSISPFYDPMIAKVIVHGPTRAAALQKLNSVLAQSHIQGLHTNLHFLHQLTQDEAFQAGDVDTGFIERRYDLLFPESPTATALSLALGLANLLHSFGLSNSEQTPLAADPWDAHDYWRTHDLLHRSFSFEVNEQHYELQLRREHSQWIMQYQTESHPLRWQAERSCNGVVKIEVCWGDHKKLGFVYGSAPQFEVRAARGRWVFNYQDPLAQTRFEEEQNGGSLSAPMPGKILSISVESGDTVETGQLLLVLEAMKMEHSITAPHAGTVTELFFTQGDQVTEGAALLAIEKDLS